MTSPRFSNSPLFSRRRFIQVAGLLAATPLAACGSDSEDSPVVDTTSGTFRGSINADIQAFQGIPYAQAPVGALRFKSPKAYKPAAGIADATQFGASCLQTLPAYVKWIYTEPEKQSEDCLTLNVWTPSKSGKLPVILFLHGGAWRTGSSALPLINGQKLAAQGCVVVTATFRLGGLGTMSHPDLTDPDTGSQGNWQLQDQAAALKWVHANIAQFGGDPSNICLIGQSAGGTSAAILAQNPATSNLVSKVVLMSAARAGAPNGFTLDDAAAYTQLLATQLGTTVAGLSSLPAATVQQGELALNQLALPASFTSGRSLKVMPVIDGKNYLADWTRTEWPSRIPVVIMNTLDEGAFFVDLYDVLAGSRATAALPTTRAAVVAILTGMTGSADRAETVVAAYEVAAVAESRSVDPGDLYVEIYGDFLLRYDAYRYANQLAAAGKNVRYGTFMHSIKAPARGVPHCAELPFVFGSYGLDFYKTKVGAGAAEDALSLKMMSAMVSFARDGNPSFGSGVVWTAHASGQATSARMGDGDSSDIAMGAIPKSAQLAVWNNILG
jgi:para-nitrobenzyl esterase